MESYHIKQTSLKGSIAAPPSKSQSLRALLFATLAKGKSTIYHPLSSPDTTAMITACQLFGATTHSFPDRIEIEGVNGKITPPHHTIDAGNSGIVLRFCAAVGALTSFPFTITGDHSICHQRLMQPLIDGLTQLGASALSLKNNGYAPIHIQGPLFQGTATISGEDSQPVSALLIASALAKGPIALHVKNSGEKPWINMTLHWFDRLAIPYKNHLFESYHLQGNARFNAFEYRVPGDFSSAAFPIAAALITGSSLTITNIEMDDPQGDKALIDIFRQMGASIEINQKNNTLQVKKSPQLSGIRVDLNHCIDAITILAVVACFAEGETEIYNAAIAKQKECNRLHCITTELSKMGAAITETVDGLIIKHSPLKGATVYSHQDHRMAMALAVAGMAASGDTCIESVECIAKSFPSFLQDFQKIGAHIEVTR